MLPMIAFLFQFYFLGERKNFGVQGVQSRYSGIYGKINLILEK